MSPVNKISTESGIVLFVERRVWEDSIEVIIKAEDIKEPFIIHWGLRKEPDGPWHVPPQRDWPAGSHPFDHAALQNLMEPGVGQVVIKVERDSGFGFMDFVLFFPGEGNWDNNLGRNYRVELPPPEKPQSAPPEAGRGPEKETDGPSESLEAVEREIVSKETGQNSWTLMHRFNLCYDLLDKIRQNDIAGLVLIYVWLRFSALRQLDWQRNYNTKPRELGHALDRLSAKLAARYMGAPGEREMIRLIMTTLGRGSDAQRVRDEVLNIMHRHHIKEVSGHFMEEWHQKLHNNSTPDDIVICEAYLDFLKSDGNAEVFYKKLADGGVTKERLESYERPIRSRPDFVPDLKGPLVHDFENFLGILKEVHSGTDLDSAARGAWRLLDDEAKGLVDRVRAGRKDAFAADRALPLAQKTIEARRLLSGRLGASGRFDAQETRDLLFLDIALEDSLRGLVEMALEAGPGARKFKAEDLADLFGLAFENVCLSPCDEEMHLSFTFWQRLEAEEKKQKLPKFKKAWAIRAEADRERIGRAIEAYAMRLHSLLQPVAGRLGGAFHAEEWAVGLFSEEALRGRPAFALSALLRLLDPILRKSAVMGNWLIISRGAAAQKAGAQKNPAAQGKVRLAAALKELQGQDFSKDPIVLVADMISGDEEIPRGVPVIITPVTTDRLSHLAIRARNAGVFFATCLDPDTIEKIKSMQGRYIKLDTSAAGEVQFAEAGKTKEPAAKKGEAEAAKKPKKQKRQKLAHAAPGWSGWAIPVAGFTEQTVGYKSINLKRLAGKELPDWINLPTSVAIPFGVFDKTLEAGENSRTEKTYRGLEEKLKTGAGDTPQTLAGLRNAVLELKAPDGLMSSLKEVMEKAGLPWPQDPDGAWSCIKRVWASKWNDRAYFSRKANGIDDDELFMSVLIQEVVNADFSFVIHTANPITGDMDEIYAEAVLGLGESLAGNYPGMPLGFTFKKGAPAARIISMPGKSTGFYAPSGGLIFRSDSNGEDLEGYAGAGLYDSFILPEHQKAALDYSGTPLVWDEKFLKDFTSMVARAGAAVQKAAGAPQDIEGAFSGGRIYVVQARPQVF